MITKEVRVWLKKVKQGQYTTHNDAVESLLDFVPYLTEEELKMIKRKLNQIPRNMS